ncbi:unnamed protein product [Prunus armeniaca]
MDKSKPRDNGNNLQDIEDTKQFLSKRFKLKNLSQLKYFLGIVQGQNMTNGRLLNDPSSYKRLVGKLIYLTITRPDLVYAVHVLSQFMDKPRQPHLEAAHKVLRYTKQTLRQGILLPSTGLLQLHAFCDADLARCADTRRSMTGYCIILGQAPISWKTKKQSTVSRSSTEAQYHSMATTYCEITWLKNILKDLRVNHTQPIILLCDNQAVMHIASNPVFHE